MKRTDLQSMPTDQLWSLHETLRLMLATRVEAEKRQLEKRLEELGRTFGTLLGEVGPREPNPKVSPKFQNPEQPSQTWSGRGRQPRWVNELLEAGRTFDELRIRSAPSGPEAVREAAASLLTPADMTSSIARVTRSGENIS
jgi:DNA-binding protein H-NS